MNYKYVTRFESPIVSCLTKKEDFVSEASLENLKPLIPSSIDFSKNIDLLGVAFNAAVVNMFNKNGDGISSQTAAKIIKNFLHKPTNIEHEKQKIVGHIISAGFSKYNDDNSLIDLEEVVLSQDPYNIALGAVVYKCIDQEFSSLLQRSADASDSMYQSISTSWEIGFKDFLIAVGSKNLKDAEIIKDGKSFEELRLKLKAYGGSGKLDDGTKIYRLLAGEVYPLGIGFTKKPAADVKGIYSYDSLSETKIIDKRDKKYTFNLKNDIKNKLLTEKADSSISQIDMPNVKNKKETIMDVEKILSELKDLLVEKKFSEESIASMTQTFADAIKQKDAEYRESLTKAEAEKEALAKEREELRASVDKIQSQLEEASQKISEFEQFRKQEEALARFNERMEILDKEYDLEDDDHQILAEELKSLDSSEESFASFQRKLSVMWKSKNKEVKASWEKAIQEKIDKEVEKRLGAISKASDQKNEKEEKKEEEVSSVTEEALANAKEVTSSMTSSNETSSKQNQTLRQKFSQALSRENIQIS